VGRNRTTGAVGRLRVVLYNRPGTLADDLERAEPANRPLHPPHQRGAGQRLSRRAVDGQEMPRTTRTAGPAPQGAGVGEAFGQFSAHAKTQRREEAGLVAKPPLLMQRSVWRNV
jgi:hypothetical protein